MKKILLSLLLFPLIASAQSINPTAPNFIMFYGTDLLMESIQNKDATMQDMFAQDYGNIVRVDSSLYYVITPNYYKVWLPEEKMLFLGWHSANACNPKQHTTYKEEVDRFIHVMQMYEQARTSFIYTDKSCIEVQ